MKAANIKFHQNPSSGGRGNTCGQTDKQRERESVRRTDMSKLLSAFCVYANAAKTFINNALHFDSRLNSSEVKTHSATSL
jgi:hypothetical protein